MKRLVFAALLTIAALSATAQSYPSKITVHLYGTPEAASYALDRSYDPDQQDRMSLVPTLSLYRSGTYSRNDLSWALVYTPTDSDTSCSTDAAGYDTPETWIGGPICGSGLFNWTLSQFTTIADAKAFYDGLDSAQKTTAIIYRVPGENHSFNRKYIVFYQTHGGFCF